MNNEKHTRRALLSSVVALVLCLTMLMGTTFAWFTDTATVSVNTIQSGTLDVELEVYRNGNWVDAKSETLQFVDANGKTDILWEPGASFNLEKVRVINKGNLSLKYKIVIEGVQGDAKLLKVIDWTLNGAALDSIADMPLEPNATSAEIVLNGTMQTTANNDYQNQTVEGIAIKVLAAQVVDEYDSTTNTYDKDATYADGAESESNSAIVATAAELQAILNNFTDSGAGNGIVEITNDIVLAEGETWTPVYVNGYTGAGVITINGNGHTISGLNDTLLAGGYAGKSGIVINDLTIANANITSSNDQGYGAFINCVDSMPKIELNNCHLKDSTITDTLGARVGGLIGWTAGYNNPNDGPVDTYITVTNCSVTGCNITASGSVGAIIGHAGSNPATYHTITNCNVSNNTLTSTDARGWRVGAIVGTANVGEVTITNCTSHGNTLSQTGKTAPAGQSELYGRFVPQNGSGKLTIDGVEIK